MRHCSLGVENAAAASYADRVVGWRSKSTPGVVDAEATAYRTAGLRYAPRQGPFNNTLELALVMGLPEPVVERILPNVTVFSGNAQVDVAGADPEVLAALPGMTPDIMCKVLEARAHDPNDGKALLGLLGPARTYAYFGPSEAFRVFVRVDLVGGRRVDGEVVFRLANGGDDPFDIVYWRDDFDGPPSG